MIHSISPNMRKTIPAGGVYFSSKPTYNSKMVILYFRYRVAASDFLFLNPDSQVGSPGIYQVFRFPAGLCILSFSELLVFQGLNTGVVLHHLDRQRASPTFSSSIRIRAMEELVRTFLFQNKSYVGDQEWLTLLSWQHPHLFHHLPCNFNFQEPHPDFPRDQDPKWAPYFHCEGEILVLHRPWTLDSPLQLPDEQREFR